MCLSLRFTGLTALIDLVHLMFCPSRCDDDDDDAS